MQNLIQYVLASENSANGLPCLNLQIYCKLAEKSARVMNPKNIFQAIDQFSSADQQLLQWLKFAYQQQLIETTSTHTLVLKSELGAQILPALLASKRCHWLSVQNPALQQGDAREAILEWENVEAGLKKLRCHLIGQQNIIFKLNPLWYLDLRHWRCGLVQIDLAADVICRLVAAPAMSDQQIKALYTALGKKFDSKPRAVAKQLSTLEMLPQLNLCMLPIVVENPYNAEQTLTIKIPAITLRFNYAGQVYDVYTSKTNHRDEVKEAQALELVKQTGLVSLSEMAFTPAESVTDQAVFVLPAEEASAWLEFNLKKLSQFRELNWQIITSADYPYQVIDQTDIEWYTQIEESSPFKWFNVELGITIHGEKINLLPLLVTAIENFFASRGESEKKLSDEDHLLAKLPDGRLLPIPVARLRPILNVLTEIFDRHNLNAQGRFRLSRVRAAQLLALEQDVQSQLKMRWWGTKQLESLAHSLRDTACIEAVAVPQGLQTELRQYQQEGLNWLQFLRTHHLSGILADDMGLGKTIQTLAHILFEKESGRLTAPCLVITPTTLVTNWQLEAKKYCPDLRVLVLHGAARQELFKTIKDYDLILTTYPLVVRDIEILIKEKFYLVALDEAQIVKNARSKAALFVSKLQGEHRLCLTGTPLENHLGELWSLFNFLMPGLLGDSKQFARVFRIPIERQQNDERRALLQKRIAPFILRRTKQSVALELPEKNEIISTIELETHQRDLYESIRLSLHESVQLAVEKKGVANSQIIILDALLKLRQICCDPRLLKLDSVHKAEAVSAKLQYLCDTLPNMIEEGRRILLFSQFAEMLALIEEELKRLKIPYVILTGQTHDRPAVINAFQNGEVPLFLISLKAGGLGLNLTAADTVIHYDPWWNPAVERQATDRAHRIGQDKSVFVYKLIMAGTIEEKILALQQRKQGLLDILQVDGETTLNKQITAEDLQAILDEM